MVALRTLASWFLFALAYVIENFFSLLGIVFITVGAWQIYEPAGWIVGGLLILISAEFHPPLNPSVEPMTNGGNSGTV